jgi:large subunit ribosomal protein L9
MSTRIILRSDVSGVGKRGDITDVSDGFARNFLLPRGLAIPASAGTVEQAAKMRKSRDLKDAKDRGAAETIARELVASTIKVSSKARDGKLFGSVTAAQIADAVKTQTGAVIEARQIHLDEPIKTLGAHSVTVKLHSDVQFAVAVEVSGL